MPKDVNNVDPAEIVKFSAIASRWWDKQGEFKPLHDINPLRLSWISELSNGLWSKDIIDVGCGGGILAESMANQGANVTAIDMSEDALEVAKLHCLETGIKVNYQYSTAEDKATQSPSEFDIVTCLEMLEHVPDPQSIVQACEKMVKPGGLVFFSTLNRNIKSYLLAIIAAEYAFKLVPKGTHDHKKFLKPSELIGMIDSTELIPKATTGLHMNPFTQAYYLSNTNIDVNYIICCQKQS